MAPRTRSTGTTSVAIVGYFATASASTCFTKWSPLPNDGSKPSTGGFAARSCLTKDEHVYHPSSAECPTLTFAATFLPFLGSSSR